MGLTKNLGWLSKYITADSTGKIGIGTASPNYGLNVVSSDITLSGIVSNRFIGLRKENNTLPGYLGLLGGDNGDNAKILGYNSAGTQTFEINASTVPTYFNGGNVGIGTTTFVYSPKLAINSVGQNSLAIQTTDSIQGSTGTVLYIGTGATTGNTYGIIRALGDGGTGSANLVLQTSGNVLIGTTTDSGAKLQVNGTVSASGRLSLGDGVVSNFNAISISSGVYTSTAAISIGASNPTGGVVSPIITFTAPNASYSYAVRGGMYYNGSNLQMEFRTTSDYRVKEDLIEDFNAIDLLDKIKIYDHKWIGASGRSYSVIAHELQNVIPYLVSGQKDAILEDGGMDLQTVDYSKLVPILIKGIQELTERIKTLENK